MTAKIQVRRDTTTNWNAGTPPTLAVGEIGLDTTLKQIKIGDGSANWTALPWLGGTLPYFASPNANIDDASLRVAGVYRWAGIGSITSGTVPPSPIDIKAADGGINMLVLVFGSVVLQHLWTDGDGTQPQKSYSRIYDTSYRAWTPQNMWGVSATEGVEIVAKSIDLKADAAVAGVASFADGAVGSPSITNIGDTNTGLYFPNADELAIATNGIQALLVESTQKVTCKANVQIDGTLDMTSGVISNVADPAAAQDAVTRNYLEANRKGQVAIVTSIGTDIRSNIGGTVSTGSIGTISPTTFTLTTGTTAANNQFDRLRAPTGTTWVGIATCSGSGARVPMIQVTDSASTIIIGSTTVAGTEISYVLVRTA